MQTDEKDAETPAKVRGKVIILTSNLNKINNGKNWAEVYTQRRQVLPVSSCHNSFQAEYETTINGRKWVNLNWHLLLSKLNGPVGFEKTWEAQCYDLADSDVVQN